MTQITKKEIAQMENEDERYLRGEKTSKKHRNKQIQHSVKDKTKNFNLQYLRGASPQFLRAQFEELFDD